jgi:hypothetical protein
MRERGEVGLALSAAQPAAHAEGGRSHGQSGRRRAAEAQVALQWVPP